MGQSVATGCLLFGVILVLSFAQEQVYNLGPLGVDPWPLTLSGFSSGGNMAQQMQVAFSSCFNGSAAFASVPYHCGVENYLNYRTLCNFGVRRVSDFVGDAKKFETEGKIDALANLKNQRHYHFVPERDTLVGYNSQVRKNTGVFFKEVGMNQENIQIVPGKKADHWMPTDNASYPSCTNSIVFNLFSQRVTGASYCQYNGALEAIRFLFKDQATISSPDPADGKFLDPIGFLYIPTNCLDGTKRCKFHVAMHGCRGSRSAVGSGFVTESGYLEVAEKNDIVMLFPQSIQFDGNSDGCWDCFEATGPTAATKTGKQMRALMNMIQTVTGIEGCT